MLDHVSWIVSDIATAEPFYDAIMPAPGVVKVGRRDDWLGYGERARPDHPERVYISIRRGGTVEDCFGRHWCFKAATRAQVDAFRHDGLAAGGRDDGAPGPRAYHPATMRRFCAIPTATGSKRFAILPPPAQDGFSRP